MSFFSWLTSLFSSSKSTPKQQTSTDQTQRTSGPLAPPSGETYSGKDKTIVEGDDIVVIHKKAPSNTPVTSISTDPKGWLEKYFFFEGFTKNQMGVDDGKSMRVDHQTRIDYFLKALSTEEQYQAELDLNYWLYVHFLPESLEFIHPASSEKAVLSYKEFFPILREGIESFHKKYWFSQAQKEARWTVVKQCEERWLG